MRCSFPMKVLQHLVMVQCLVSNKWVTPTGQILLLFWYCIKDFSTSHFIIRRMWYWENSTINRPVYEYSWIAWQAICWVDFSGGKAGGTLEKTATILLEAITLSNNSVPFTFEDSCDCSNKCFSQPWEGQVGMLRIKIFFLKKYMSFRDIF